MNFENNENKVEMIEGLPVHILKNGTRLLIISPERSLKFSDGTSLQNDINKETRDSIKINVSFSEPGSKESIKKEGISDRFLTELKGISDQVDIVLVSPEFIRILEKNNIIQDFPNIMAYNPNFKTQDLPSSEWELDSEQFTRN